MKTGRPRKPGGIEVKSGSVRLYVRESGGAWRFQYYPRGGGKLVHVKRSDKARAIEEARRVAAELAEGDAPEFLTVRRAEWEWLKRIEAEFRRRQAGELFAPAAEAFIASRRISQGQSPGYVDGLASDLDRARAFFGGDTRMGGILAADIDDFLQAIDAGPRRRANIRASLVTFWRWARDRGMVPDAARTEAEKSAKPRVPHPEIGILTPAQLRDCFRIVRPEYLPWIALGAFAGLRSEEISPHERSAKRPLQWEDVRWEERFIDLHPDTSKQTNAQRGRRRIVPICDALADWLAPYRGSRGAVIELERPTKREANRIAADAGWEWPRNALRHSYASYRMGEIRDAGRVAEEMGNSAAVVRRNYDRVATEAESRAWFAIRPGKKGKK